MSTSQKRQLPHFNSFLCCFCVSSAHAQKFCLKLIQVVETAIYRRESSWSMSLMLHGYQRVLESTVYKKIIPLPPESCPTKRSYLFITRAYSGLSSSSNLSTLCIQSLLTSVTASTGHSFKQSVQVTLRILPLSLLVKHDKKFVSLSYFRSSKPNYQLPNYYYH